MAEQGVKIKEQDGTFYLSGVLDEYADLTPLLTKPAPLCLNVRGLTRFNSIGIRNLLRFLSSWGAKPFVYAEAPSELIDQINMIPALLGVKGQGTVASLLVPYECPACSHEEEVLDRTDAYRAFAKGGPSPVKPCPSCGKDMTVMIDSFFVFLEPFS